MELKSAGRLQHIAMVGIQVLFQVAGATVLKKNKQTKNKKKRVHELPQRSYKVLPSKDFQPSSFPRRFEGVFETGTMFLSYPESALLKTFPSHI